MKFFWVILQPFFYSLRPFLVYPLPPEGMEGINWIVQLTFNAVLVKLFGWHIIGIMCGGSVLAMGLHPVAGHFISEHYIMFSKEKKESQEKLNDKMYDGVMVSSGEFLIPETCSYYGILNNLTFNVGYHVEHHDFPSIPGRRLPLLRKIAPEFYDCMQHHTSWSYVLYKYIMDPSVGPYARVKRPHKLDNDDNQNEKLKGQ